MWTSFIAGTAGSLAGSAYQAAGEFLAARAEIYFLNKAVGMIGFSAVCGGLSAQATGGDFWGGFVTAATVAACNHAMHWAGREIRERIDGGDDKNVTFGEAWARFRSKTGGKMYQDLRKLGIKNLHISEFDATGRAKINLCDPSKKHFNVKTGIVHGTITLILNTNGTASIAYDDLAGCTGGMYDFTSNGSFIHDVANFVGLVVNGFNGFISTSYGFIPTVDGKPFPIEYSGEIPVNQ